MAVEGIGNLKSWPHHHSLHTDLEAPPTGLKWHNLALKILRYLFMYILGIPLGQICEWPVSEGGQWVVEYCTTTGVTEGLGSLAPTG